MSDKSALQGLLFDCDDSWFFRESRPMEAPGGTQLCSQFPPPVQALAGALRTQLGALAKVDWYQATSRTEDYVHGLEGVNVKQMMGDSEGLGALRLTGPYLWMDDPLTDKPGELLVPAPAFLLAKESTCYRLSVGDPVESDLGYFRLAELPVAAMGAKPLEDSWIRLSAFNRLLAGENQVNSTDLFSQKSLITPDNRLGIGRHNASRSVEKGLLYQTQHVRLKEGLSVVLGVAGIAPILLERLRTQLAEGGRWRLGAEGRTASVRLPDAAGLPLMPAKITPALTARAKGILLVLTTPADLEQGRLPGFNIKTGDKDKGIADCWEGRIAGVQLRVVSVVSGKCIRRGGWDLVHRCPRPMHSLTPAGSSYFCEVMNQPIADALTSLQPVSIGANTEWGYGAITCGLWV